MKHPLLEARDGLNKITKIPPYNVYKDHEITKLWDSLYKQPFYKNTIENFNDYTIKIKDEIVYTYDKYQVNENENENDNVLNKLMKYAEESCFGLGDLTIKDKKIRDSWEINANDIDPGFIDQARYYIFQDLSLSFIGNKNFSIIPHKLLIYTKGSHFEEHVDSQHRPNHIGTILLDIPISVYKGGELIIKHHEKEYVVNLASSSKSEMNYVAFFNDVKHRVVSVISGERIILQFDIVIDENDDFESGKETEEYKYTDFPDIPYLMGMKNEVDSKHDATSFNNIFNNIKTKLNTLNRFPIAFMLKYRYANHELNPSMLKCLDKKLYELLETQYVLKLVNIICNSEYFYNDDGKNTRYYYIWNMNIPEASQKDFKNMVLFESTIQGLELFDHDGYIEFTGNDSQPEICRYLGTALVIKKRM